MPDACYVWPLTSRSVIPYSGKFSRGPNFAEGQSSKISRSDFCRWPFQNCSAHDTWLTPPLTACVRRLKPAEKLVKDRLIEGEMAHESHMIEAMVRGYHVYKEIWCAAVGEELSCIREVENYRDPFTVAVVRSGIIVSHVPRKISSVCSMFYDEVGNLLQSYWRQMLFWSSTTTNWWK